VRLNTIHALIHPQRPQGKDNMTFGKKQLLLRVGIAALSLSLIWQAACAGPLRDRLTERRVTQAQKGAHDTIEDDGVSSSSTPASLPAGIRVVHDVAYGSDPQQRFDVYSNAQSSDKGQGQGQGQGAPVIFMVHGGAWRLGSKSEKAVIENKVARWVPKGFIFISTNYRLLPQADPVEQARDVARALAAAQDKAASWGGDRNKFILMGHSAGAHLVSLLATTPALSANVATTPWLGTIALDSAAFNVVEIMEGRHLRFYDNAFGRNVEFWKAAPPFFALTKAAPPILAVCSTRRDDSCPQAHHFSTKASTLGVTATVLEKDFSHREINLRLGEEPRYTAEVESFMSRLDKGVARLLAAPAGASPSRE